MSSRYGPRQVSLLVRNLPLDCRSEEVRAKFERFGDIRDVYLPRDYYTGRPKGFGFVEFRDSRDAEEALFQMDRSNMGGREISVVMSKESRKSPREMLRRDGPRHEPSRKRYFRERSVSRGRSRSHSRSRVRKSYSRSRSRSRGRRSNSRSDSQTRGRSYSPSKSPRNKFDSGNKTRSRSETPRSRSRSGSRSRPKYDDRERDFRSGHRNGNIRRDENYDSRQYR